MAASVRRSLKGAVLLVVPLTTLLAFNVRAQDFSDVQTMLSRSLFRQRAASDERQEAEHRRIEALDQRAQQQAQLLQDQAQSVQQLRAELQSLRDERQLIGVADAFDAAVASARWPIARSMLADTVTVNFAISTESGGARMPADRFIEALARRRARVLPRSNQQVQAEGDRALLTANGYDWGSGGPGRRAGLFEYRFVRTPDGWRIEGLSFVPVP